VIKCTGNTNTNLLASIYTSLDGENYISNHSILLHNIIKFHLCYCFDSANMPTKICVKCNFYDTIGNTLV